MAVILLLGGLTVFYFSGILFSDKILSFRDLTRYYYPFRWFAFQQIKSGSFPFWNPYAGSGQPLFAALQSAVLYPLSVIYLLPDFDLAFNLFIVLHIFLGGLFFYLLGQELKFSQVASLLGAVIFMFGGYLIAVINLTTTLAAAIWFPLVFLFFNRALADRKIINVFLSSVFLGLMFLGGEPTPLYATAFALAVYSVVYSGFSRQALKNLLVFGAVIGLFGLLYSFQIIPFIEFIKISTRSKSFFGDATYWSFPPRDMVYLILPFFYGPLEMRQEAIFKQDWLLLFYVGIVSLTLFVIALFFARDRTANYFKGVFVLGLIFIFGKFTPLYKIFYKFVPGFGLIRYPVKFFFLNAVSFSFLAGCGWDAYCRHIASGSRKFSRFIKFIFIASFIAAMVFLALYQFRDKIVIEAINFIGRLKLEDIDKLRYLVIFKTDFFNLRRLLVFFILTGFVLFLGAKRKINLRAGAGLICGLVILDLLGGMNIEVNPAVRRSVLHKESANIAILKNEPSLFRVYTSFGMNKANEVLNGKTYEEAFEASTDNLASNRMMEHKIYDSRGYFSIHNLNYFKVLNLADTAPLPSSTNILNMLNVKYILTTKEIDDPTCRLIRKAKDACLYENLNFLERAYLAQDWVVLKTELDIANSLKSKDFHPDKLVILEEGPKNIGASAPARQDTGFSDNEKAGESVKIIKYEPNESVIEANVLHKPKFLVLADNYYPGWEAFVDGKKDKIYRANFTLRAVYLPEGRHVIVFRYNPVSFKIGAAISLVTLAVCLVIFWGQRLFVRQKVAVPTQML